MEEQYPDTYKQSILMDKEQTKAKEGKDATQVSPLWPQMKAKRSTYEWFIPKGILKTNW